MITRVLNNDLTPEHIAFIVQYNKLKQEQEADK
jgi:hypothetical protein